MRGWAILGAIIACFYVIYVVGLYLVSGSGPFDRAGVTLPSLVVAYLVSGTIGGAIIGLLRPLASSFGGLLAVAILTGFVAVCGVEVAMYGFISRWHQREWVQAIASAVLLGTMTSVFLWSGRRSIVPPDGSRG